MSVPGLSLLGHKPIRGFVSILRYINPTIIIIFMKTSHKALMYQEGIVHVLEKRSMSMLVSDRGEVQWQWVG